MSEGRLFDDIARTLASPMPRRQAIKRIIGGLAAAALGAAIGTPEARAAGKPCKKTADCPGNQTCCAGFCCPSGHVCSDKQCKQNGSPSKPGDDGGR